MKTKSTREPKNHPQSKPPSSDTNMISNCRVLQRHQTVQPSRAAPRIATPTGGTSRAVPRIAARIGGTSRTPYGDPGGTSCAAPRIHRHAVSRPRWTHPVSRPPTVEPSASHPRGPAGSLRLENLKENPTPEGILKNELNRPNEGAGLRTTVMKPRHVI